MKTRFSLLLLALLTACSSEPSPPDNLLPTDQMALILRDAHLAEQRVSRLRLNSQDSAVVVYQVLQKEILKKYKTDTTAYFASYRYYISKPETFKEIYKAIVDSLSDQEARNQKKARADSARRQ